MKLNEIKKRIEYLKTELFHEGYWDQNHFISQCNNQTEKWTHVFGNYLTTNFGANKDVNGTYIFAYQGASNADIDVKGALIVATDVSTRAGNVVEGLKVQVSSHLVGTGSENVKGIHVYIDGEDTATNYGIYIDPGATPIINGSRSNWGTGYGLYSKAKIASTKDIIAFASSDKRLKKNIINIENPIDKIKKLNGISFEWKDGYDKRVQNKINLGVIAQEVQKVLPEVVKERDDGYLAVKYEQLVPVLIEGMKEQQTQIDELKQKLEEL